MTSLPPSPPSEEFLSYNPLAVETAARVLRAQGEAITALSDQFVHSKRHNGPALQFCHSLSLILNVVTRGGKVVISGMGKSHKIGSKLVATLHSFGIPAAALHPSEALHGDVGLVTAKDVVVLVSASGNSPELAALIQHLPSNLPTICLTCNEDSPLAQASTGVIPAPLAPQHREQALYGLPAPSVTTTLCLAVGDAMCIALHESLVEDEKRRRANFSRWHPGGAIGLSTAALRAGSEDPVVIPWASIPQLDAALGNCDMTQLWRSVALSPFIVADGTIYKSSDVIAALESGLPIAQLKGQPLAMVPSVRGHGLCVFRDENNQPTGLVRE